MLGKRDTQDSLFAFVNLEKMIPPEHLLRRIEKHVDFSFVDCHVEKLYSAKGRPSIDPQVLVRMMIVGYLYGITSERRLCQEVHLNLAYRWFCGLGLEGEVPHHSTFSKNRHGRLEGNDLYRRLFYEVVDQAAAKGLVGGRQLSVDATLVRADAAMGSLQPIVVEYSKEQYIERLDEQSPPPGQEGKRRASKLTVNQTHRSKSDPDARVATRWGGKRKLSHSCNVLMDNKCEVIVEAEASDPSMRQEGLSCVEMTRRFQERTGSEVDGVGGDSAYARGEILGRMGRLGVKVYAPEPTNIPRPDSSLYGRADFLPEQDRDALRCPNGQLLKRVADRSRPRMAKYAASPKACRDCLLKERCTKGAARTVTLHLDQKAIDHAAKLRGSDQYVRSQKSRKRIEALFGEGKERMGLSRARLRGRAGMDEQCLMTALAQNLKRIVGQYDRRLDDGAQSALAEAFLSIESLVLSAIRPKGVFPTQLQPPCFPNP